MTQEQAEHLKSLISDMKEKQLKAFSNTASVLVYNQWVEASKRVDDYIDAITQ